MKEQDYIKKWLEDSLTEEEREEFEQTDDFKFVDRMSKTLSNFKAPDYSTTQELESLINKKSEIKVIPIRRSFILLKVAAMFIMVLGFVYYFSSDFLSSDLERITSKMELKLPDATSVVLNTHSKLTYDNQNWSNNRQAYLEGEGFFEVAKGNNFDIVSKSGKVSVLGTAFNIKDRKNFFEVKCYHGLVKVAVDNQEVLLSKNQAFRLINGRGEKIDFDEDLSPSWVKGESSFQSVPYIQVIKELERQYGVAIISKNINTQLTFSGKFSHSDLTLALESITKPLNIGFEVSGHQVRLTSDIK